MKFLLKDQSQNCFSFVGGVLSYFFHEHSSVLLNLDPSKFKKKVFLNFSQVSIFTENQLFNYLTKYELQYNAQDFKLLIQKLDIAFDGKLLDIKSKFKCGPHLFCIFWFVHIFRLEEHLKALQDLGKVKGWTLLHGKHGEAPRNLDFLILLEKFNYNKKYRVSK